MSIKYLGYTSHELTKDFAQRVSEMDSLPGERSIRPGRIAMLDGKIKAGLFFSPRFQFCKVKKSGKTYRVDGQGSSTALAGSNGHFPEGMRAIVDTWEVDDMKEAAVVWEQFDNRVSSRKGSEIINAHGRTHAELGDISSSSMNISLSGLAYGKELFSSAGKMAIEDRAQYIHTETDFVLFADKYTGHRMMRKVGVMAAIYLTWDKYGSLAEEFWDMVLDASAPTPKHPTRMLHDFLRDAYNTSQGGKGTGSGLFSKRAYYDKCIRAWNAYSDGIELKLLRHNTQDPPPAPK